MPHIFISYSKKDTRLFAETLSNTINRIEGFSAWMDESLESAESWALQIQAEIDRADLVIVLLSPDINRPENTKQRRSFVLNEIDYAQQDNKRILPILAQRTRIPVQISGIQHIDFTQNEQKAWERLFRRLESLRQESLNYRAVTAPSYKAPDVPVYIPQQQTVDSFTRVQNQILKPKRAFRLNSPITIVVLLLIPFFLVAVFLLGLLIVNSNLFKNISTNNANGTETSEARVEHPTEDSEAEQSTQDFSSTAIITPTTIQAVNNSLNPYDAALQRAINFSGTNNHDWQPFVYTFEDGVPMALVPVGCFRMGNDEAGRAWTARGEWIEGIPDGGFQCFNQPFWIDLTEVTQIDFSRLGGWMEESSFFSGDYLPVEQVIRSEAERYCEQQGKRLPTEDEWEYAARGIDNLFYPWGNVYTPDNLTFIDNSGSRTSVVGSRPAGASWVGALDMAGNVWEWTNSLYEDYPYQKNDGRENIDQVQIPIMSVRGSSWYSYMPRITDRSYSHPDMRSNLVGFRCVRDID